MKIHYITAPYFANARKQENALAIMQACEREINALGAYEHDEVQSILERNATPEQIQDYDLKVKYYVHEEEFEDDCDAQKLLAKGVISFE